MAGPGLLDSQAAPQAVPTHCRLRPRADPRLHLKTATCREHTPNKPSAQPGVARAWEGSWGSEEGRVHGPGASFSRRVLVRAPVLRGGASGPGVEASPPSRSRARAGTSAQPTACPGLAGLRDAQPLTQTAQGAGHRCGAPGSTGTCEK